MLELNTHLPKGALLDHTSHKLANRLEDCGGFWLQARADQLRNDDTDKPTHITAWHAHIGKACATPVQSNTGNSSFTARPYPGLACIKKTNCGFSVPMEDRPTKAFSAAIRFYRPTQDARTLISLNPSTLSNYLFVQQERDEVYIKDQQNTLELSLTEPQRTDRPYFLQAGYSKGRLFLRLDMGDIITTPNSADLGFEGPTDLFIACRSGRGGLEKTLGAGILRDIMIWPDRNILDVDHSDDLQALDHYQHWED